MKLVHHRLSAIDVQSSAVVTRIDELVPEIDVRVNNMSASGRSPAWCLNDLVAVCPAHERTLFGA